MRESLFVTPQYLVYTNKTMYMCIQSCNEYIIKFKWWNCKGVRRPSATGREANNQVSYTLAPSRRPTCPSSTVALRQSFFKHHRNKNKKLLLPDRDSSTVLRYTGQKTHRLARSLANFCAVPTYRRYPMILFHTPKCLFRSLTLGRIRLVSFFTDRQFIIHTVQRFSIVKNHVRCIGNLETDTRLSLFVTKT